MAKQVSSLARDGLLRQINMYPLASTEYLMQGKPRVLGKFLEQSLHLEDPEIHPIRTNRLAWKQWKPWDSTRNDALNAELFSFRYRKKLLEAARLEKLVEGQVKFHYIHVYAENADQMDNQIHVLRQSICCGHTHQRGLDGFLLESFRLKYSVVLSVLPFLKLGGELTLIVIMLRGSPKPIWSRLSSSCNSMLLQQTRLSHSIFDLKEVLSLRSRTVHAPYQFHQDIMRQKLAVTRREMLESVWKENSQGIIWSTKSHEERKMHLRRMARILNLELNNIRERINIRKRNAEPTLWYSESFWARTNAHLNTLEQDLVELDNGASSPHRLAPRSGHSEHIAKRRVARMKIQRVIRTLRFGLDSTAHPIAGATLNWLISSLLSIRRYRAALYPIPSQEIAQARQFYMKTAGRVVDPHGKPTLEGCKKEIEALGLSRTELERKLCEVELDVNTFQDRRTAGHDQIYPATSSSTEDEADQRG